jgi:tyrosine-protein phosphatase SIW14
MSFFLPKFALLLIATFPLAPVPQSSVPNDHSLPGTVRKISIPGVRNAGEVSDHLYRGAQPMLSQLPELKKLGVTTVIDLREEFPSTAEEERRKVEALGMRFVSIPIGGFANPKTTDLAAFFRLLRDSPQQTIFIHCQFGKDRTGVMIAAYRMAFENWSADQAFDEMMAVGFNRFWHPPMEKFVRSLPSLLKSDPELKDALD